MSLSVKSEVSDAEENARLEQFGYEPAMERSTGRFASFAVAFAFVSIATGTFTTYGSVLNTSGPVGIWTWPISVVGSLAIALMLRVVGGADPGHRLLVSVDVAVGEPVVGVGDRLVVVYVPGGRRRSRSTTRSRQRSRRTCSITRGPRRTRGSSPGWCWWCRRCWWRTRRGGLSGSTTSRSASSSPGCSRWWCCCWSWA